MIYSTYLHEKKNVQLVTDTVIGIDKEQKIVKTKLGSYPFDQLILGMGGEPNDFGTPGVKENGFTLWSFEDSVKIREHIERTVAKAALEPNDELRRAMLTFVVCGSGFTGIEMIGELIDWKKTFSKRLQVRSKRNHFDGRRSNANDFEYVRS